MKPPFFMLLAVFLMGTAAADTIISKASSGWNYLHIANGVDPAIADTDFNLTWFNPTTGGYTGGNYNGPAFTTNKPAPFHYGGVDGLSGGTTLTPRPPSGQRYTAYFYKVFDGGNGFNNLKLSLLADDGAFVYLNGQLIARDGVTDPDIFTKESSLGNEISFDNIPLIGAPIVKPGLNLLAISVHQDNPDSSDLGFDLEITGDPIIATTSSGGWGMLSPINAGVGYDPAIADTDFNTTWRNQSFGGYVGGNYNGPAFTGNLTGPFAYGGVDGIPTPGTTIPSPNSGSRRTAYFVKEVNGGANGYNHLKLRVLADDGAYIYLNGNLVAVTGQLPAGAASDTWSQMAGGDASETTVQEITLDGVQLLHPGPNLLAVSVHNSGPTSSDLGFSLELAPYTPVMPVISRGPYLQSGSHDRMTVRWRTNEMASTRLRYGTTPGVLNQVVTSEAFTTEHIVSLTGLTPDTKYYYQIESTGFAGTVTKGNTADFYFKTYPVPGTKSPARLWVIGDSGTTSTAKYNVYNAYRTRTGATHTDAWLMLGDNAYNSGTDTEFQAALFDSYPELLRNTVLWSCLGNHEAYTANGTPYLDLHTFPTNAECGGVPSGSERYYSFDRGNIHFISIDSETGGNYNDAPGGGGMVDWLEMDLQATDKDWIVAFMHHGPYTKGSHNSDTESHHIQIRRYVVPLLEKYGADLVLAGHSHCYERSMLINGHHSQMSTSISSTSNTFTNAHKVDGGNGSNVGSVDASGNFVNNGGDGVYQKPLAQGESGTVYSIVGASGKLSGWTGGATTVVNPVPHPVFIVNLRVMGSMAIDVNGNTLHAQYIDDTNTVRDDFTIVKGSTVSLTTTDATFSETGPDNTAVFNVTRAGATKLAENVIYQVGGTATNGSDYTPVLSGVLSFGANESQKSIVATRVTDALAEGAETLNISLTGATRAAGTGGALRDRYFIGSNTGAATLADAPSQAWWFNQFGAANLVAQDWKIDADGDGLNRLQEYAWGGVEGVNNRALLPQFARFPDRLELTYTRNNAVQGVTYQVRQSADLNQWSGSGIIDSIIGAPNPTGMEQHKATVPTDSPIKFLDLKIDLAE